MMISQFTTVMTKRIVGFNSATSLNDQVIWTNTETKFSFSYISLDVSYSKNLITNKV